MSFHPMGKGVLGPATTQAPSYALLLLLTYRPIHPMGRRDSEHAATAGCGGARLQQQIWLSTHPRGMEGLELWCGRAANSSA